MHLEGIVSKRAELIFAGKAGTGFDLATGHELPARLRKIERGRSALRLGPANLSARRAPFSPSLVEVPGYG